MNTAHNIHHTGLLRVSTAALVWVLLFLTVAGVFFPVATASAMEDFAALSKGRTSSNQSGAVLISAKDASLPVALTGISARGAVLMEADTGDIR